MSLEDLPCRDFVELATDYLEGALPPHQRLVVEYHLAFCQPCVDYLAQMRWTLSATGRLREDDIAEPVVEPLLAAFRELTAGSAPPAD